MTAKEWLKLCNIKDEKELLVTGDKKQLFFLD